MLFDVVYVEHSWTWLNETRKPSVDVRWRPLLWVVIVTHLIARTLASQASLAEADIASRYYVSAGLDITPYKQ